MMKNSFRIAMCNSLRLGPYQEPDASDRTALEWLIVERSGPDGKILTISDTGTPKSSDSEDAPDGLSENNSILGLLAEADEAAHRFLLVRHSPPGVTVPGTFFPADGTAQFTQGPDGLRLRVFGRHAHRAEQVNGKLVLHDVPFPQPPFDNALNWHFDADERRWVNAS
ncbi:hypothetical protein [Hoeflea sp.]|uniref:hypothetical protein n=1 Tax=Hoeflea sp. TaxID=1940281 RepID=UPI003BB1A565